MKKYAVYKVASQYDLIMHPPPIRDGFESEEDAWEWIKNKHVEYDDDCGRFTVVPYITKTF